MLLEELTSWSTEGRGKVTTHRYWVRGSEQYLSQVALGLQTGA